MEPIFTFSNNANTYSAFLFKMKTEYTGEYVDDICLYVYIFSYILNNVKFSQVLFT